jgi:predicted nucleic acid-binding protein
VRLYLDANSIIYTVEGNPEFKNGVLHWVRQVEASTGLLLTSRLALLECRSHPMSHGDQEALAGFDSFFASRNLVMLDVSSDVIDLGTELRARYNFRSPDAIHMATAILIGADVFLTSDKALARCTEIRVVVLVAESST